MQYPVQFVYEMGDSGGEGGVTPEIISVHISCLHVFHNQQIGFHI